MPIKIDRLHLGALVRLAIAFATVAVFGCKPSGSKASREIDGTAEASRVTEGEAEPNPVAALPATRSNTASASIPFSAMELPGNKLLDEATEETWESERIAEAVATQLKGLSRFIVDRDQAAESDIAEFAEADVGVGQLRPSLPAQVFGDSTFIVRRPNSTLPQATQLTGRQSLSQQLNSLGQLFDSETTRYEQKVTRVQIDASQIVTQSLVHLAGKSSGSNLQFNLSWECVWGRTSDGALRLQSIRTTDYEEVLAPTTAFADCTQSVFGDSSYWRTILSYGTDYWLDRLETRYGLDPAAWQGLAVGDVNNDGLDDLYVCQAGGIPNGLLVQNPDGTGRGADPRSSGQDLLGSLQNRLHLYQKQRPYHEPRRAVDGE